MTEVFTAFIDENNCIGCSKCIRVCPTDAIVGAKHLLHTVIPQFCTSCEECINRCPTNCINLSTPHIAISKFAENQLKARKQARLMENEITIPHHKGGNAVLNPTIKEDNTNQRKQQIADAIARVKARKKL